MPRYLILFLLLLFPFSKTEGQVRIITTICGDDTAGYSGDGGPAINARLDHAGQLCLDKSGNLYIADGLNHRIRKIKLSTGIITTVAGTGTPGYNGDHIQATDAQLQVPQTVAVDVFGNIYIADAINRRIRKVDISTGVITTIAGNGISGSLGDNGPAINARIKGPTGLSVDKFGNVFLVDADNNTVRKIEATTGIIRRIAGNGTIGYSGDNAPATNASLNSPGGIAIDSSGNIFVGDAYNNAIRRIDAITGIITTIAGNGSIGYSGDGGPSSSAVLNKPYGIFIDNRSNIYFAEWSNGAIRKIDGATNIISTVAGTGTQGFSGDGGPATNAQMIPEDMCIDTNGTMYIADYGNNRIRKVYDPTLGIPKTAEKRCKLYPNPAHHEVTIEHAKGHTLRIYDVTGRTVMEQQMNSDKETIAIAQLNSGVYVVQVTDGDGMQELIQLLVN